MRSVLVAPSLPSLPPCSLRPTHGSFGRAVLGRTLVCAAVLVLFACGAEVRSGGRMFGDDGGSADGGPNLSGLDLSTNADFNPGPPNECGDHDPGCTSSDHGPPKLPFPLGSDPNPDPNVSDNGVSRDPDGYLVLGSTHAQFDFIYTANTDDWGRGTVSKINSKTVKEVARYFSVTCYSNMGGGKAQCDGTNGCCTRDDHVRFSNRAGGKPSGPHQQVQIRDNYPSRTAVDFNGDVWVANRAFGVQSSVTKIANEANECTDRNGRPGIQTSSDASGDGIIDTDCNRNGAPDDIDDVTKTPCTGGRLQEFWGVDDECILFTSNTNVNNSVGRPLALGAGGGDFAAADAWAGSFNDGKFFRVDGLSGQIKVQGQVGGNPYGATIDSSGILWAPGGGGGPLCYLDTTAPQNAGCARMPGPQFGYGIGMDRDQNVWVGGYPTPHAFRYTPDRTNGFGNLGKGFWTTVQNPGLANGAQGCQGRGIAADSRTPNQYYVWMACHGAPFIVRIDGMIPLPKGADTTIDGSKFPAIRIGGGAIAGAGVDVEQNVWGVASTGAIATRIKVDMMGNPTAPKLDGTPGTGCPVGSGDYCSTAMTGVDGSVTSYTYSDFSGFGLRNFTIPKGVYSWVQPGCKEVQGAVIPSKWARIAWDADVPPNTSLTVRARSGETAVPDNTWGGWTGSYIAPPGDFAGQLAPIQAKYIQVEFNLTTMDKVATPRLKSFALKYECPTQPG